MKKPNIILIAGTRPNFVKIAPLYHTLSKKDKYHISICHTGQHFDKEMSQSFWEYLQLPPPDFQLNVRGVSVSETIGKTLIELDKIFEKKAFDLVIVVGDVNATIAGALAARHNGIRLMHVEAGLRSFDNRMPEETNRILTDHLSDYLMISEESGEYNLKKEGIDPAKMFMVGNIMIECLLKTEKTWKSTSINLSGFSTEFGNCTVTFHRPENVDEKDSCIRVVNIILDLASYFNVAFPIHPRTKKKLNDFDLLTALDHQRINLLDPLPYFKFLKLVSTSELVVTDSGGIQEETSYLKIPCVTLRNNTERPVTIQRGTNKLLSIREDDLVNKIIGHHRSIKSKKLDPIPLWDDQVSHRISQVIEEFL